MKTTYKGIAVLSGLAMSISLFSATIAVADTSPLDRSHSNLSLTIHKTTDEPDTGSRKGISGIKFTLTPITPTNSDSVGKIGTASWWQWAESMQPNKLVNATAGDPIEFEATNTSGHTCLSSYEKSGCTNVSDKLKQGLYLVKETGSSGQIGGTGNTENFRPGLPFFVSLPLPDKANDATNNKWDYDPTVDPKNQLFNTKKTLNDVQGDKATYTIQSTIPSTNMDYDDTELYPFGFEDLVPAGLTADTSNIKVYYTKSDGTAAANELTVNTDYKVTTADNSDAVADPSGLWGTSIPQGHTGKRVLVYFTKVGADKLKTAAATAGNQVFVQIPFSITDSSASITNEYVVHNPKDHTPNPTPIPVPNDNKLNFVNIALTKSDAKNNTEKLSGAKFSFYECTKNTDGDLATVGDPIKGYNDSSNYKTAATVTEFTTGSGGTVTAYHIANAAAAAMSNNGVPDASVKHVLCAVETQAPAGYSKVPYPIEVAATKDTANDDTINLTVNDSKKSIIDIIGNLPTTGAAGVTLLLIVGAAMLFAGIIIRNRREKA